MYAKPVKSTDNDDVENFYIESSSLPDHQRKCEHTAVIEHRKLDPRVT